MELTRPKTPADALKLQVRGTKSHPRQFWIENDYLRLKSHDREYVAFSGYFGVHGPEMFAAAPELVEALKGLIRYADAVRHTAGMGKSQLERLNAAKALLSRIEGDA